MKNIKLFLAIALCLTCSISHSQPQVYHCVLTKWVAGISVTEQSVEQYGIENCFKSEMINEGIFVRIKGLSYKDNCTVALDDLRYIKVLHYNANNQITLGEVICNKKISDDLLYIFRELFKAKYRIESIQLVDNFAADDNLSMLNNNTSCFNFRTIAGSTQLSKHSLGLAIDINPLYNPYVKEKGNTTIIEPSQSKDYIDRHKDFPYKIDTTDLCYKLFTQRGFEWGGNWQSLKDYQHFEKD